MSDAAGDTRPCKACGRAILFVASVQTGRLIPLDTTVEVYEVRQDGDGTPSAQKTSHGYYVSHFRTCPKADSFSGSRPKQ